MQQLDLTGPYEVFASIPGAKVHLIWKDRTAIDLGDRARARPHHDVCRCPPLDVLCVPGGAGINALLRDAEVLGFLRAQAARARYVTSVCTGALVLGAAGLLKGRRATTHWASHDFLAQFGAIPTQGRVVRDGNLFTAAASRRASISASRWWPRFWATRRRRRSSSRSNTRPRHPSGPELRTRRRRPCSRPPGSVSRRAARRAKRSWLRFLASRLPKSAKLPGTSTTQSR